MAILSNPIAIMISFTILDTVLCKEIVFSWALVISPRTLKPLRQRLVIIPTWFLYLYHQRTAFVM